MEISCETERVECERIVTRASQGRKPIGRVNGAIQAGVGHPLKVLG
jgi:hypothetical protein